jgi:hypothetical protein
VIKGLAVALAELFVGLLAILLLVGGVRWPDSTGRGASTGLPQPTASPAAAPTLEARSTQSPPTTTATPAPPPVEQPITLSGKGATRSAPFTLNGGSYRVGLSYGGRCNYLIFLQATDGSYRTDFGETVYGPLEAVRVLSVPSGTFWIEVNTNPAPACPWSVTFQYR